MAITLTQVVSPSTFSPVSADIWYGVNSSSSTLNDFKYIFDIWQYNLISNATSSLGSYRVPPRPVNGYGLISPSKLLKTAMNWTFSPNISVPTALTTGCVKFGFRYGFTYNPDWGFSNLTNFGAIVPTNAYLVNSTGTAWDVVAGDTITILMTNQGVNEQFNGDATVVGLTSSSGTQYIQINKLYASSTFGAQTGTITSIKRYTGVSSNQYFAYQGTRQYAEIGTNFTYERVILADSNFQYPLTNYKNSYAYPTNFYGATGPTGPNPYIYGNTKSVYANQFETTSILLDKAATASIWLRYETYDANYNTTGRKDILFSSNTYPYIRYDLPSGPQNIVNAGYIASATMSAAKFYSILMYNKTQFISTTIYNPKFVRYFEIIENCSPYPRNYRLCFMNRHGGTDYWNFNWKNTNVMTQAPTIYRKQLAYNYTIGDRQDTVLSNKANETYVVSTDWISQSDAEFLKELLTSPDAYVYDETLQQKLPIIVLDTAYQQKTAIDNKLFCITLNFRYSYDINLQNN